MAEVLPMPASQASSPGEAGRNAGATHFELFGIEPCFSIDLDRLAAGYRRVQQEVHPDRHATAGERERRLAMEWAVRANEAYKTLQAPAARARYLLSLAGLDATEGPDAERLPPEFLMAQFEWRESMDDARQSDDRVSLRRIRESLGEEMRTYEDRLAAAFDGSGDLADAIVVTRKLSFVAKLREDVDRWIDELED